MKNKTKQWRRLARKRYEGTTEIRNGRQIRNIMARMGEMKAMLLPIHKGLFDRAGISTPVLDASRNVCYDVPSEPEVTAETTGEPNATA